MAQGLGGLRALLQVDLCDGLLPWYACSHSCMPHDARGSYRAGNSPQISDSKDQRGMASLPRNAPLGSP